MQAKAAVSDNARQHAPEQTVQHKQNGNGNHRPANYAACAFNSQQRANQRYNIVRFIVHTRTQYQIVVEHNYVHRNCNANNGKANVNPVHFLTRPRFAHRVKQKYQGKTKGQMNGSLQLRV